MKAKIYLWPNFSIFFTCCKVPILLILASIISLPVFSNQKYIDKILINGEIKKLENDTLKIYTTDKLCIVLSRISDHLNYTYQCIGIDSVSIMDTSSLSMVYPPFPEGKYQLQISLSNQNLNQQPPLIILVTHSFLDSWNFFQLLVIYILFLFGGASYFIILSNYRSKLKLYDLRNDWTNKLHNDIGADLSSVSLRINTLNKRLEKLDPSLKIKVEKIYFILDTIQNKLRFVFDLVDPKKNSLQVMLSEIESFAKENFSLKGINFDFKNNLSKEKPLHLDIGQINKIYLVMKEAINNAIKHSNASDALIEIKKIKGGIFILIKDNGDGFDLSKKYDGNGIDNLLRYGQEGFLDIRIHSLVDQGTEIEILIPEL